MRENCLKANKNRKKKIENKKRRKKINTQTVVANKIEIKTNEKNQGGK